MKHVGFVLVLVIFLAIMASLVAAWWTAIDLFIVEEGGRSLSGWILAIIALSVPVGSIYLLVRYR